MAKRITTLFQPIDPKIMDDPDIAKAGAMAEFLYIRGLLYIRRCQRDGTIPKRALLDVSDGIPGAQKHVNALVKTGLWVDDGQAWSVRNWEKWNCTQSEIADIKQHRRDAGRLGGHKSKHSEQNPSPSCEYCKESGWLS
ncbi:MAG: hypothetical protein FWD75_03265 [Propionibacteriaceae bacterium]|nr:hypothetical protein [Propionibacteriaceae bacterium]